MMDVVQGKLARSFQTTFAAVRLADHEIEWRKLGDSEIVIGDAGGNIIASTVERRLLGADRRTDALPDHCNRVTGGAADLRDVTSVVVGSDGFFGAFPDLHQLLAWCISHEAGAPVTNLHQRLARLSGDDDISAVIIRLHPSSA
jgi:serine/threonine protein phosphatase PrpC